MVACVQVAGYKNTLLYNNVVSVCISLFVDRVILKDTHTHITSNPRHITSADFFFFLDPQIMPLLDGILTSLYE